AATFDSNLLPGVDNQYEIGYSTNQRWKNISISNLLNLGQLSVDPVGAQNGSIYYNTTLNSFKGYASSTWSTISSLWNSSSTSIYYNTGNVGIGTAAPIAGKLVVNGTIDVSNNKITSVATPIASTDAATKGYVDAAGVSDTIYSLTANNGMYNNRIADMTPPAAYTEVCFKSGSTQYDYHSTSASTSGGNCVPGDVGYIIEADERSVNYWEMAKQTCLNYGMRLPEPFEWKLACKNAATWSLINMTGNWEWASNFSLPMFLGNDSGVESAIFGGSGCNYAGWNWVGYGTGYEHSNAFRCVR
ncbi:hypothetical protein HZC33_03390, partial [Candidatus Wolfebacteria bacterium]|nr:hypothetical protein [Candidatus Wolfebacteria bacterium]